MEMTLKVVIYLKKKNTLKKFYISQKDNPSKLVKKLEFSFETGHCLLSPVVTDQVRLP